MGVVLDPIGLVSLSVCPSPFLQECTLKGIWEHMTTGMLPTGQEKRPQDEPYLADTLTLGFSASRTLRNNLLSEPPSLSYFVMAL